MSMDVEKIEYASLADLENDQDELPGLRPNVDANEFAPPLPHGLFEAVLSFENEEVNHRWIPSNTTKGVPVKYQKTTLILTTEGNAEEAFNGRTYSHYPNTLVRKNGTTGVLAVLQGIGVSVQELAVNSTRGAQALLLTRYIDSGQASVSVELDWEASFYDAEWQDPETGEAVGKEYYRLRGMSHFFPAVEGEPEYERSIPTVDGKKRFYPWIDLDMSDKDAILLVLPSTPPEQNAGRDIRRCFVRSYIRKFVTRTDLKAGSAGGGTGAVSARPVASAGPVREQQTVTPADVGKVPVALGVGAGAAAAASGATKQTRPVPVRR